MARVERADIVSNDTTRKLHDDVDHALRRLGCDIGCAECHGMLCGMLCNPECFDPGAWLRHVTGASDRVPVSDEPAGQVLWDLLRSTQVSIGDDELSFQLLIPHDGARISRRIRSLGAWCRGFLSGFGLAGITDLSVLSDDSRDFLKDLARIARANERSGADEGNERALAEIIEYVRVGALLLRDETRFLTQPADSAPRVH
jgi:yecA family protein